MAYLRLSKTPYVVRRDEYSPVYEIVFRNGRDVLRRLPVRAMITDEEPDDFDVTLFCIHPDDLETACARLKGAFPATPVRIVTKEDVEAASIPVYGLHGVPAGSSDFYLLFGDVKQVAFNPVSLEIGNDKGASAGGWDFRKAVVFEIRKEGIGQILSVNETNVPTVD